MINLNLRDAIIQRVQDRDEEELLAIINDSMHSDERALPGLGVLFEVIWDHLDPSMKDQLIQVLKQNLPAST